MALPLCTAGFPLAVTAGQMGVVVCCGCSHAEWHAIGLDDVLARLGELSVRARLVDGDFAEAVESLGLTVGQPAVPLGWQFVAEGVHEGVLMTIGQRVRPRIMSFGFCQVVRIEVLAGARSNLGGCAMRRAMALGRDPQVQYGPVVHTGDSQFDSAFVTTLIGPSGEWRAPLGASANVPTVQFPWLDGTVREHLIAGSPEEVLLTGNVIGMLLTDFSADAFAHVVAAAVQLAKWKAPPEHPYR